MGNPFGDLPPDEYDALLLDMERRGMVYPVIRDQHGRTIDGHQRERACAALGIEPHYRVVPVASDTEREELALVLNIRRRHLDKTARDAGIRRIRGLGFTVAETAELAGISEDTVSRAGAPEVPADAETPPRTDKQGRTPDQRGGRPRASRTRGGVPAPIKPSIHVVMKAFRRDLTSLLVAYEEAAQDDEFTGAFGDVIDAIREALQA